MIQTILISIAVAVVVAIIVDHITGEHKDCGCGGHSKPNEFDLELGGYRVSGLKRKGDYQGDCKCGNSNIWARECCGK